RHRFQSHPGRLPRAPAGGGRQARFDLWYARGTDPCRSPVRQHGPTASRVTPPPPGSPTRTWEGPRGRVSADHLRPPSTTTTSCSFPSSRRGIAAASTGTPSSVADRTPRCCRSGFSMETWYKLSPWRHSIEHVGHIAGMQGSIVNTSARRRSPIRLSIAAWYIHPADPVYHVQPPRPTWLACA